MAEKHETTVRDLRLRYKRLAERAMSAQLADLYRRIGSSSKTLVTQQGFDDKIIALYGGGMPFRGVKDFQPSNRRRLGR